MTCQRDPVAMVAYHNLPKAGGLLCKKCFILDECQITQVTTTVIEAQHEAEGCERKLDVGAGAEPGGAGFLMEDHWDRPPVLRP